MKTQAQRELYIPTGSTKVVPKGVHAEFYLYEGPRGPSAMAFIGNARKPSWRYYFASTKQREERIARAIADAKLIQQRKAERKAENAAYRSQPCTLKVGDILYSSWGYDQTNIDFYQVTALIGEQMVELRQIAAEMLPHEPGYSDMSGKVIAKPGVFKGEAFKKRVSGGNTVKIESYASAWPWDGKPKYCSWYA